MTQYNGMSREDYLFVDKLVTDFYNCTSTDEKRKSELYALLNENGYEDEEILDEDQAIDVAGAAAALGIL